MSEPLSHAELDRQRRCLEQEKLLFEQEKLAFEWAQLRHARSEFYAQTEARTGANDLLMLSSPTESV